MDDLISRQAAIDAIEGTDWYHINKNGVLVHGANSETDIPLYKADDVYKVLAGLPSAERRGRWIKKYRGNYLCSVCGAWYRTIDDYGNIIDGEMTANYCESCGAKMDEVETNETCTSRRSE